MEIRKEDRLKENREYVIQVKDLGLKYSFVSSMDIKREILNLILNRKKTRKREIKALTGVSFNIKQGEVWGIIGKNGAGKSTLLKVLAKIYDPDTGSVEINDKNIFLMSLGAGFQKELSAIENIYLNGLLLGMKREEIDENIDVILRFAGIEDFKNNPLKSFSTGMKSRLAFSIACTIKPDILLIDEIFSVGDEEFRQKSKEKIQELIQGRRTVVIVSHNLEMIKKVCSKVIWLEKGKIMGIGSSEEIISQYKEFISISKHKRKAGSEK